VRIGLNNFTRTQPMNREFLNEREDSFSSTGFHQSDVKDLFEVK